MVKKSIGIIVGWFIDLCVPVWCLDITKLGFLTPQVAHNMVAYATILLIPLVMLWYLAVIICIATEDHKTMRKFHVALTKGNKSYKFLATAGTWACIAVFVATGHIWYALMWTGISFSIFIVKSSIAYQVEKIDNAEPGGEKEPA